MKDLKFIKLLTRTEQSKLHGGTALNEGECTEHLNVASKPEPGRYCRY